MSVVLRPPLPSYPRDPATALRTLRSADASADRLERRRAVWASYLGDTDAPPQQVPLATRWLRIVQETAQDPSAPTDLVPGSFYPAGFRDQVLAGCGLTHDPVPAATEAPADGHGPAVLLSAAATDPRAAETRTLTLAALTLNLLSRYGEAVALFTDEARRRRDTRLWSEVARARYAASLSSDDAARAFVHVAQDAAWAPRARVGAAIRLVAHHCRTAHDVEAAARWVDVAERLLAEHDDGSAPWTLYRSHLDRARALHDWRRRDAAAMWAHLSDARAAARALQASAESGAPAAAALHAERLVLEAELKAFLGRPVAADPARAEEVAHRIVEIDPADPYANLAAGDTAWVLGADDDAVERLGRAADAGTLAGALAAHRLAVALDELGRATEAERWHVVARDLDEEAA